MHGRLFDSNKVITLGRKPSFIVDHAVGSVLLQELLQVAIAKKFWFLM